MDECVHKIVIAFGIQYHKRILNSHKLVVIQTNMYKDLPEKWRTKFGFI